MPLLFRISATDWVDGGWDVDQSVALLKQLKAEGVDFVDVSSGGAVPGVKITLGPGYQVPLAAQIRRETSLVTGSVGLITEAAQAEAILAAGEADAVLLGRLLLRDPYFPLRAAPADRRNVPVQYARAF
jgi:2,4-dienoyl-CoA reductase-like NADH-dependent reductase (Old Yellow Enzyme family)